MEKIVSLVPQDGKLVAVIDGGQPIEIKTSLIVPSWIPKQDWAWRINVEDPATNNKIRKAKFVVSTELYVDGALSYAGRDVAIAFNGTGLILGSGKPYVRAVDISVARFMADNGIKTLMKFPPSTDRIRKTGFTIQFRVYDVDGNEQMPVAGSFLLDQEKPWIVEHRKVQLSTVSEWRGLYIPNGYKFKPKPWSDEDIADKLCDAIMHSEEATVGEEPAVAKEEETSNNAFGPRLGDIIGDALDNAVTTNSSAESAGEVSLSVEQAPQA